MPREWQGCRTCCLRRELGSPRAGNFNRRTGIAALPRHATATAAVRQPAAWCAAGGWTGRYNHTGRRQLARRGCRSRGSRAHRHAAAKRQRWEWRRRKRRKWRRWRRSRCGRCRRRRCWRSASSSAAVAAAVTVAAEGAAAGAADEPLKISPEASSNAGPAEEALLLLHPEFRDIHALANTAEHAVTRLQNLTKICSPECKARMNERGSLRI